MGADSYNIVPANMRGYIPTSVTLTDDEQTSPTWRSTLGAVAIGVSAENADGAITTATQTRQIVGVAAGTQDTDAVNVAQLKALGSTVDANKISFVSINKKSLGENDNENNDGATGDDAIASVFLPRQRRLTQRLWGKKLKQLIIIPSPWAILPMRPV